MNTSTLAAAVVGFLLGGLTVSIAAELDADESHQPRTAPATTRPSIRSTSGLELASRRQARTQPPQRDGEALPWPSVGRQDGLVAPRRR